jgi:hypothetical protein
MRDLPSYRETLNSNCFFQTLDLASQNTKFRDRRHEVTIPPNLLLRNS